MYDKLIKDNNDDKLEVFESNFETNIDYIILTFKEVIKSNIIKLYMYLNKILIDENYFELNRKFLKILKNDIKKLNKLENKILNNLISLKTFDELDNFLFLLKKNLSNYNHLISENFFIELDKTINTLELIKKTLLIEKNEEDYKESNEKNKNINLENLDEIENIEELVLLTKSKVISLIDFISDVGKSHLISGYILSKRFDNIVLNNEQLSQEKDILKKQILDLNIKIKNLTVPNNKRNSIEEKEQEISQLNEKIKKLILEGKDKAIQELKENDKQKEDLKDKDKQIEELKIQLDNLKNKFENKDLLFQDNNELLEKIKELEKDNLNYLGIQEENKDLIKKINSIKSQTDSFKSFISKSGNLSKVDKFMLSCEIDPYSRTNDELLKYITYCDCSIQIKKELLDLIIKFLDELINQTKNGNSSSTNLNGGTCNFNFGKASGKYSNQFFSPIMNFLKEKIKLLSTQKNLEYFLCFSFKELISEYIEGSGYNLQKSKTINNVLFNIEDKNLSLFENLLFLSESLLEIKIGKVDLSILSSNINNLVESKQQFISRKMIDLINQIKEEN